MARHLFARHRGLHMLESGMRAGPGRRRSGKRRRRASDLSRRFVGSRRLPRVLVQVDEPAADVPFKGLDGAVDALLELLLASNGGVWSEDMSP